MLGVVPTSHPQRGTPFAPWGRKAVSPLRCYDGALRLLNQIASRLALLAFVSLGPGERWQVGATCVLEVTSPRIPCRTFAGWLEDQLWVKRFTNRGAPGAYLRVISPGLVSAGDPITVVHRPPHDVTIAMMFRALTTDKALQPRLAAAGDALPEFLRTRLLR